MVTSSWKRLCKFCWCRPILWRDCEIYVIKACFALFVNKAVGLLHYVLLASKPLIIMQITSLNMLKGPILSSSFSSSHYIINQKPMIPRIHFHCITTWPLSAGNTAEFSQADNSKTLQRRVTNLTSLDSLGSCESIYVYLKPPKPIETLIKSL